MVTPSLLVAKVGTVVDVLTSHEYAEMREPVALERARVLLATVAVVVVAAACGEAPAAGTGYADGRFGDEHVSGMCESIDQDVPADAEGHPTAQEAVRSLIEQHPVLEDATVTNGSVSYDGEEVGSLSVAEAPGGGYYISSAYWCYP